MANTYLYDDQESPYGMRISHSDYDFEMEDSELVMVASKSPCLHLEALAWVSQVAQVVE